MQSFTQIVKLILNIIEVFGCKLTVHRYEIIGINTSTYLSNVVTNISPLLGNKKKVRYCKYWYIWRLIQRSVFLKINTRLLCKKSSKFFWNTVISGWMMTWDISIILLKCIFCLYCLFLFLSLPIAVSTQLLSDVQATFQPFIWEKGLLG